MRILDMAEAAFDRLVTALGVLVGLFMGFFAISLCLDWLLLTSGRGTIPWIRDVIEYLLYAGVFLGAPWVLRRRGHIQVDLILSSLGDTGRRTLERAINLVGLLICATLAWLGYELTVQLLADNATIQKTFTMPSWIFQALFLFTMVLLSIEFLFRVIRPSLPGEDANVSDGF